MQRVGGLHPRFLLARCAENTLISDSSLPQESSLSWVDPGPFRRSQPGGSVWRRTLALGLLIAGWGTAASPRVGGVVVAAIREQAVIGR